MKLKKGIKTMLEEATARTQGIAPQVAEGRIGDAQTVFVDIRDVRELERDGMIPGAFHAPRGMLEFWIDPESPYFKPIFGEGRTYILYCAHDWRAVLAAATLADMGLQNVLHLEGGFSEWKKAGRPVGQREHKHKD